ncbi:TipAS antibiotic-recognition domain-containing protein [Pseudalkalibacillus decolorationis]|uniref:TipAS antibiotic-recognition domain-containing protein n=1 Tax=Pseudalkalibacillus decolorationis TaxID=163879 RepID=UPI00214731DB|nr:TipAS antibiotic-recognition domain-containing protein [Pseudalkalibacillus decolorationis]
MEKDITGLINAYTIEGEINWYVIFKLIQNTQNNHEKIKTLEKKWFESKSDEIDEKMPNLNKTDSDNQEWIDLFIKAQTLTHKDPASDEVQAIVERMTEKVEGLFGDDPEIHNRIWEVRKSPELSMDMGWYPLGEDLLEFLDRAFEIHDRKRGFEN